MTIARAGLDQAERQYRAAVLAAAESGATLTAIGQAASVSTESARRFVARHRSTDGSSQRGIDNGLAEIEKGQQLAGHFPSDSDLAAAWRIMTGETSYDHEVADADYRFGPIVD